MAAGEPAGVHVYDWLVEGGNAGCGLWLTMALTYTQQRYDAKAAFDC
jgi:hypothetical protein